MSFRGLDKTIDAKCWVLLFVVEKLQKNDFEKEDLM